MHSKKYFKEFGVEIKNWDDFFKENGICKSILTTDTAEHFYEARGYHKDRSYTAKNQDEVFVKVL